jgi:sugar phosphate isomerase/epimerase
LNKIVGHTLGTPGFSVIEAIQLFHSAGLDGAEIIWQDDYSAAIPESGSEKLVAEIKKLASDLGMEIAALTPYMSGYNSLDEKERKRDLDRLFRCLDVAAELDCKSIRVYAGSYKPGDAESEEKWRFLVESLQYAGEAAQKAEVQLCVENHFNTMTVSAEQTADLMRDVASQNVGILYDQANLTFTHQEPYQIAIPLQKDWIRYVHVKDLVFIDPDKPFSADEVAVVKAEDRAIRSRIIGEGSLDWKDILRSLMQIGYDGYLSFEIEYRWHPQDLPAPEIGFKTSAMTIRRMLKELEEELS